MSYILLVIDIQHTFRASHKKSLRENCKKEIKRAIRNKANIIFVEYKNYGSTIPSIKKMVTSVKYDKSHLVIKESDDGSQELLCFFKHAKLRTNHIKVCGVNTDACVLSTVKSLAKRLKRSKLEILSKACNSTYNDYHLNGLRNLSHINNVKIK